MVDARAPSMSGRGGIGGEGRRGRGGGTRGHSQNYPRGSSNSGGPGRGAGGSQFGGNGNSFPRGRIRNDHGGTGRSHTRPRNEREVESNFRVQSDRKHLGFMKLNGLLTEKESDTDAVIMALHRNLQEWEELMNDKSGITLSDDLFVMLVHLLGEKVCEDSVLTVQQGEIVSRAFGEGFEIKLKEACSRMSQPGETSRRRNGSTVEVDYSKTRVLGSLRKFFSFVALKFPTTAIDKCHAHILSIIGTISVCLCYDNSKDFEVLLGEFKDLVNTIGQLKKKKEEKEVDRKRIDKYGFTPREEEALDKMQPPEDFRSINIIPSVDEILSLEETFLRPNKKAGSYESADHYLDVQFRLLKEDFVRPLKRGIRDFIKFRHEYLTKKKRMPPGNVRFYPNVQIKTVQLIRESLTYTLQLNEDNYKRVRWERSKRLLQGSLLVFTADDFRSLFFAVVARRDEKELKNKGQFGVTWEGNTPGLDRGQQYLMFECEVYFEAYRHTLQILKELQLEAFPMKKFIVDGSVDVSAPKYLEETESLMNIGGNYFSPLVGPWPNAKSLQLDDNQFTAFHAALTKEFVIIQGPPGTGKTFLGLKITEVFLQNLEAWWNGSGPILVVCYTNHALDQFLEGIIKVMREMTPDEDPAVIRVGGRSKTESLDEFSLIRQRIAASRLHKFGRDFWITKNEANRRVRDLEYDRAGLMNEVVGLSNPEGIASLKDLGGTVYDKLKDEFPLDLMDCLRKTEWYGISNFLFDNKNFSENHLLNNWFAVKEEPINAEAYMQQPVRRNDPGLVNRGERENDSDDDEDYDLDELLANRIFETVNLEAENLRTIEENKLKYLQGTSIREIDQQLCKNEETIRVIQQDPQLFPPQKHARTSDVREQNRILENRLRFLKLLFQTYRRGLLDLPDVEPLLNPARIIPNLGTYFQTMHVAEKWAIYFHVIERARLHKTVEVKCVEESLIKAQKNLQEILRQGDGQLLQKTKVVGMTTTGAAKYNDLLRMMKSKIVIVEEAAEVLEAHIVTSISRHCEHLILIGDHQQLRPSTTVYELSKNYNLDISLFERMLNNNLNCYKLRVQHRMRPEICDLIVGTIYKDLEDHASVRGYPKVDGVEKNLFFISHNEFEKAESDSMSKSNVHEAKLLAFLCRYLVQQGYTTDRITILTTYTGQMFLLKSEIREFETCKGVRVSVVDNFQGEENDIILLSLVRSNEAKQIGFLKTDNRICVAISRAKHGLYIAGNMNLLASNSKTWEKIKEKLEDRMECGPKLELRCQIHDVLTEVGNSKDFAKVPEGGCHLMCDAELKCGHNCKRVCHIQDRTHTEYKCRLPCRKACPNHHLCRAECFQQCPPCQFLMEKTLPCSHPKQMKCYVPESSATCVVPVQRKLPCGHITEMACHKDPATYSCKVKVTKKLRCSHEKPNEECHVDPDSITCKIIVPKTLVPCGHVQEARCHIQPEMIRCETTVQKRFHDCGHEMGVKCRDLKLPNIYCKTACPTRLECGHACTKSCHVGADPNHLEYECRKECARPCSNGHTCSAKHKCSQKCPPCPDLVEKTLDCGMHKKKLECSVDPAGIDCIFPCELKLPRCGHKCEKLCFQPCEPCQVKVRKLSPCGHIQEIECNLAPSKDRCEELVKPLLGSACNHNTFVPCKIQNTVTPQEAVKYCNEKCEHKFETGEGKNGCGHICSGTCSECHQGRLHKKCQDKCEKALVCGHVCTSPCSNSCPPCKKPCGLKCDHSECKQLCGEPCTDCNEKCTWECEHKKCTKRCRELCDRTRCEVACPKKIENCGHDCIGFCGEPCPKLCRICDKEELTEVFFGDEDEENARFILLEDCNHCFESAGLDYWMMEQVENGLIQGKGCPRCKTPIRHSRRYGDILRSQLKDVLRVKKTLFGNEKKVMEQQLRVIEELNRNGVPWRTVLPHVLDFIFHKIAYRKGNPKFGPKSDQIMTKKVDEATMASIELITNHGKDVIRILRADPDAKLDDRLSTDLIRRYRELFTSLMSRELPLSNAEIKDFDREFDRLFDLKQIYMRKSSPRFTDQHPRAQPLYDQAIAIVFSPRVYTKQMTEGITKLLMEIDENLKTGLGISDRERRQILDAFPGMALGHWFKCPNGHIYMIGDCGGAMVESRCNECGSQIGGANHALRRDNAFAREMDGAAAPLWPNTLDR